MARKLTEEERNNINLLTAAFVAAMPAHLRSHAGSVASSLVRIPRDVITARDINRIVGRIGEHKDELKALIREVALTSVEVAEGEPESFELVVPADEPQEAPAGEVGGAAAGEDGADAAAAAGDGDAGADSGTGAGGEKADAGSGAGDDGKKAVAASKAQADGAAAGEKATRSRGRGKAGAGAAASDSAMQADAGGDEAAGAAAAGAGSDAEAEAEPSKPSRRSRRRRHVGDKGGLAAQGTASDAAEADAREAGAQAAGNGSPAGVVPTDSAEPADSAAAADEAAPLANGEAAAAEQSAAAQEADSASGTPAAEEPAAPAPEKKRRRTRRSRKKPAQPAQADAARPAAEQLAEGAAALSAADAADADVSAAGQAPAKGGAQARSAASQEAPLGNAADDALVAGSVATPDDPVENNAATAADSAFAPAAGSVEPADAGSANADQAASPDSTGADLAASDSAAAPRASQHSRGQRGGRGRRGGQNPKREGQKTLAEVPYIRRGGQTEADLRARIVQLDQRFWMNGWLLSHPGAFQLYEKELLALNEFVVNGTMIGDVTRRQLAYQMGGDEKFFEYGSDGFKLLRSMGVEDLIRHRPLPKADLLFHAPRRRKHMRVLVTENLDPWLDVHDLMYEDGVSQILGERIHAVVLGGGTPVLEQNRLHLLLDTLGADSYEVLYWGDIDRAGLDILIKLQALLEGKFEVKPFVPAYQLMCDRAMARFPDPADNEKTGQVNIEVGDTGVICGGLTPEAAEYARAVIEGCSLIPQEILTKRDL